MDSKHSDISTNKKVALLIALLSSFLAPFMASSINIALPSIGEHFGMSAISLSWVATSYLLAATVFLVPIGKLADIHGRKKVFTYGIALYSISSLLSALSASALMLIVFRVLNGISSAMIFSTGIAILISVFPLRERGKALGISITAVYLGLSLGPFLGGFLTYYLGWQSIFLVNIPIGLLLLFIITYKLKGEWAEAKGENFDLTGSIIYGLSLISIIYGMSRLPTLTGIVLVLAGGLSFVLFIKWESKLESPVLNITLFKKNPVFLMSSLTALINYGATFAVTFLISLYLQHINGYTAQSAGLVLVAQPVVMALFSPFAGKLSDRVEPKNIASIGMVFTTLALFMFTFISSQSKLPYITASLVTLGFGLALFASPNTNAIMSSVEKKFYGVASGTVGTMRMTGQMLSMGIVTVILASFMGNVQIVPENHDLFISSIKVAFYIFSAISFMGIFVSLSRGRIRNH